MRQDAELIELRERVDCRTVLERAGWLLDAKESTRRAAKYRPGAGEIIIVTHDGRGCLNRWKKAQEAMLSHSRSGFGAAILVMPGRRCGRLPALLLSSCPLCNFDLGRFPVPSVRVGAASSTKGGISRMEIFDRAAGTSLSDARAVADQFASYPAAAK